jgi:UMF1 family MFS transporter
VTVAYSVYFTEVVARSTGKGEALWGRGYALSMIIVGLISPLLGSVADFTAQKRRFLFFFTLLCVLPTGLLYFVQAGDVALGIILFVIANFAYNAALTFYDAFLREIAQRKEMGKISGYGWALGYIGGLASLIAVYPFIRKGFGPENINSFRLSFPITALFFFFTSLPTFIFVRDKLSPNPLPAGKTYLQIGIHRVTHTIKELGRMRELLKFFICYLIYSDGINTVIVFSAIFATRVLGFTPGELMIYFISTQIAAAAGTYFLGLITDRIGVKKTISFTLWVWALISIWAFFVQSKGEFYILGWVAASALGSNQSASRAFLGYFVPADRSAEFFGFFSLTGKFSAVLGPLLFGELATATGSPRWAILSLISFFLLGLFLLRFVRNPEPL